MLVRILLLIVCLPLAAEAQKITIEFDEAHDFSDFKTYAIMPGQLHSRNPSLNSPLVTKMIDASIRKYMAAKGMQEVPRGPHDLNVRYSLGSGRRTEVDRYPAGWRGYGTRTVVSHYTEGTLIIDLHQTRTRELLWRAIAIEDKNDPMKIKDKLDDMVRKSIDKYPPKMK
jgi:hypothetical protein